MSHTSYAKYHIHSGPVFLRHRLSSRYCCYGNWKQSLLLLWKL